eukprot:15077-Chlamydomonas_euryale.AAC.3
MVSHGTSTRHSVAMLGGLLGIALHGASWHNASQCGIVRHCLAWHGMACYGTSRHATTHCHQNE